MSSATSTNNEVRLKPDTTARGGHQPDSGGVRPDSGGVRLQPDQTKAQALQPWQFFVLAALGCATAVTFVARGRGVMSVLLLSVLMGAAALAGMAALRMLRPLLSTDDDRVASIGRRTREALEREKMLALRSIKELEFDRAMGKLSEEDFKEMSGRLRARAARLMRQLDAGEGYRVQIERELEKRLADAALKAPRYDVGERPRDDTGDRRAALSGPPNTARTCASCSTMNDADARFCKNCGTKL